MDKNKKLLKYLVSFSGYTMVSTAFSTEIYHRDKLTAHIEIDELLEAVKDLYKDAYLLRTDPYEVICIPNKSWQETHVLVTSLELLGITKEAFVLNFLFQSKENPFHVKLAMRAIGFDTLFHYDTRLGVYHVFFLAL